MTDSGTNLPRDFLWGVSTSAYQSEGGYNGPGQPRTNWARWEEKRRVAPTGRASDFWTRYEEDFRRVRELGLNAFRLGIEWSRIQPSYKDGKTQPPPFDMAALEHYARMLVACREQGLEPVLTLQHFVHPSWLGPDPWLDPATPELFERYISTSIGFINESLIAAGHEPVRTLITINEPNMLVFNNYFGMQFPAKAQPGLPSLSNAMNGLLCAHVRAYNCLHDLYASRGWGAPAVAFNNYCSDLYWLDKFLLDLTVSADRGVPRSEVEDYICKCRRKFDQAFRGADIPLRRDVPSFFGTMMKKMCNALGGEWFSAARFAPALDAIYNSPRTRLMDFIGLDYYDPFAAHIFRLPVWWDHESKSRSLHDWVMNSVTAKWWDWSVLPSGMRFFCKHYTDDYQRPILIAENGMALRRRFNNEHFPRKDKLTRSEFIRAHVNEVERLAGEGLPIFGYLHWSLFDNYEWGSFTPRFGLYALDYQKGTDRLETDFLGDCPSQTYSSLVRAARQKQAAETRVY
ncbi:MAG TPA: family 1 glycosylhydrolase [Chthoniobacteraceae bacterium]|jgi:beta-glucosidase/6-phospho-beta-glucosidase/beta-galactosidase|nr:family 1 glycosylhydrolase [Chthoniobacteraceae bacterium]